MHCAACSETLPDSARFCLYCGTPCVADATTAAIPTPAPPRVAAPPSRIPAPATGAAPAEERRPVTVLFCDLVGSTALSGRLDPETLRSVVLRYFAAVREPIESRGGTVEKFIGDAVMAVFGIPDLHEDDGLRAVGAALEVPEVLDRLNEELHSALGVRLAVRIGIATGEAVVGTDSEERQVLVSGEVANVAARLEQNAAPGEILIDAETRRAVSAAVVAQDAGPMSLRGKSAPVRAYRLSALRGDDPGLLRRFDLPFVGREEQFAALDGALRDTTERGRVRVLTLAAEAGLGKTRLLREWLERDPSRQAHAGVGRCRPHAQSGTLTALAEAVSALLDNVHAEPRTSWPAAVTEALALLDVGMLRDGTPTPSVEDTCASLAVVLRHLAADAPLILVLDDFHWSRPALRATVERLSALAADFPLLLICAGRPELLEGEAGWPDPHRDNLSLPPLPRADCARLAEAYAERESGMPQRFPARVLDRAEGNPLLLEQLLAVADPANLDGADGLPSTIQALLGVRIDALGTAERAALSLAAVLGREFTASQVAGLARSGPEGGPGGDLHPEPEDADATSPALRELAQHRMIEAATGGDFRFSSGLVQEVSYQRTAKRVRAERHERTAGLLVASRATDHEVGTHLELAHRYRSELGLADGRTELLRSRAMTTLAAAGSRALARADLGWAEPLLRRATALSEPADEQRPRVLWQLAEVLVAGGNLDEGRALLAEVAADPAAANLVRAHARLALAVHGADADPVGTARVAEEVSSAFTTAGDELGQARSRLRVAQARQTLGRHGEAEQLLLSAADHAVRADAEPERAAILGALGVSLCAGPTPVAEAVARCRELLARHGVRRIVQITLNCPLAVLLALDGRPVEAGACLDAADQEARAAGYAETAVFLPFFRATIASLSGRPQEAETLLRLAERAAERLGGSNAAGQFRRARARVLVDSGDVDAARALLLKQDAREPVEAVDTLPLEDAVDVRGLLARVLVDSAPGRALELARRAVSDAGPTDSPVLKATAALDLARCAQATGRGPEAERAARSALDLFAAKGHRPGVRCAQQLLDQIGHRPADAVVSAGRLTR
ncbi:AAA family ATPase [Catenulispora sp. NF23]|uniref:adenylate/guanylate cyclase domain-containing protein n=1 Tax=Catenulispora pinistramenti TaxID=2705254 RepID=UPI001BAB729D|nr:adenylate/guanylate cyclase domain-containing protein [Catenulispora pinistramenti]MBS2538969.1 AAA family ATPase [Catenulispora pinistramenti]